MIEQAAGTLAVAPTRQSFSARGTLQLMYPPREAAGQRGLVRCTLLECARPTPPAHTHHAAEPAY